MAYEVTEMPTSGSANPAYGSDAEADDPVPEYREEEEAPDHSEPPTEWKTPQLTAVPPESSFEFRSGAESTFWAQVLTDLGDDIGKHFRKVARTAISGPNRLELVFPKSYLFAKQVCEKVEVRSRVEEVVFRLAGKPVQIVFSVTDDTQTDEPIAKSAPPTRRLDLSTNGDPYVDKAIEIFNAKIMKKDAVNRTVTGTD